MDAENHGCSIRSGTLNSQVALSQNQLKKVARTKQSQSQRDLLVYQAGEGQEGENDEFLEGFAQQRAGFGAEFYAEASRNLLKSRKQAKL